jgi:hypothetical protein
MKGFNTKGEASSLLMRTPALQNTKFLPFFLCCGSFLPLGFTDPIESRSNPEHCGLWDVQVQEYINGNFGLGYHPI